MPAFQFVALDERGKEQKGVLEGDAPRQIRQQLRERGWMPMDVKEVVAQSKKQQKSRFTRGGASATDLTLITRQLATLVRSGLPIEEVLAAVAEQSEKPRLKSLMSAVRARVMEGHTLSDAFGQFPNVFPELYRTTVAAGEQAGHLDIVLERLADYTENRQKMRQKIQLALFYPVILSVVAILVVSGLLAYVVPQVVEVFENTNQELPPVTIFVIALSDFLRDYGLFLLIALVLGYFAFTKSLKNDAFRYSWHLFLLKIPLISKLIRGMNSGRFARTLSILAESGVPILEALRLSSQVVLNEPMKKAVEKATVHVREGAPLNKALAQSGHFPPMTVHLIASGEASGNLENMLERVADHQEREIETLTSTIVGLFEPILILVMGVVVLVIVLAVLMPILDLNTLVS